MSKRFQESSIIIKIFRSRHLISVPFEWVYYYFIKSIKKDDSLSGLQLWKLLIGNSHFKMHWYYTHEEFLEKFNNK